MLGDRSKRIWITVFLIALAAMAGGCGSKTGDRSGPKAAFFQKGVHSLMLGRVFPVPGFRDDISTVLTDLCYRPEQKVFRVCSEGGDGQFPLSNGEIVFGPPGFMTSTDNYLMRGLADAPVGLCGIDNRSLQIFYGSERLALPAQIGDVTGLAFDGKDFWFADRRSNQIHQVRVVRKLGKARCQLIRSGLHPGWGIVGIAWDGDRLWTCDQDRFYVMGAGGSVEEEYEAPRPISGFCFAEGSIYATSAYSPEIYRFDPAR